MRSWNGRGLPSASTATTSPSSRNSEAGRVFAIATISGKLSVTSLSRREKMRTTSPLRWIWMRAPSSLYSMAVWPPCSWRTSSRSSAISASLRDLAEHVGHLEDREGPGDQGRLLRAREGLLEGRPSDVQRAGVRFGEDPADDQVDGRRDLLPPQGTQERGQERALLQAFRGRLEFRREVREAGERSLFRGRRGHGESGPSEASGFNVSPAARVSVGPRKR